MSVQYDTQARLSQAKVVATLLSEQALDLDCGDVGDKVADLALLTAT